MSYFPFFLVLFILNNNQLSKMQTQQFKPPNFRKLNFKKLKQTLKQQRSILQTKPTQNQSSRLNTFSSSNNRQIKLKLKPLLNLDEMKKLPGSDKLRQLKKSERTNSSGNFQQYANKIRIVKTEHLEKQSSPEFKFSGKQLKELEFKQKQISSSANVREKALRSTNQNFRIRKNTQALKGRSKSQQIQKTLSRQERVNKFQEQRQRNPLKKKKEFRYKNEKLNIIIQDFQKIVRNIPEHLLNEKQFQTDIKILIDHFKHLSINSSNISRQMSENVRTFLAKLIFFIGYQIYMRYSEDDSDYRDHEVSLSNFYHIYFAYRLKIPLLVLQSFLVLIDEALQESNYSYAQQYSQKCLLASIYYGEKFYEFRCIEKLSMCEYYRGNICQATYLHDNNGNITQQSIQKVKDGFNEQQELEIIFHHIYQMPVFDVRQILADYDSRLQSYKALIIFNNPRIGPKQSMKSKKQQLKIDLIKMQRIRQFKLPVQIMKKQFELHEKLFTVHKETDQQPKFKLLKRNLTIDEENQSSQILRAHQSLNRIKIVNKKPIKRKLAFQFMQFLRDILTFKI